MFDAFGVSSILLQHDYVSRRALALTNHERGGFDDITASDAARAMRFSSTLKTFAKSPAYDPRFIVEVFERG